MVEMLLFYLKKNIINYVDLITKLSKKKIIIYIIIDSKALPSSNQTSLYINHGSMASETDGPQIVKSSSLRW
jgi:hypothetical protein